MSNRQKGFTLIELMIVTAIIGMLVAIAGPLYQRYLIRGQITEGLTLSAGAKEAVSVYFMDYGTWPTDNAQAGISDGTEISGDYTTAVAIKDNVIEIKYGGEAHPSIIDGVIRLTAVDNDGSVSWTCASTAVIESKHLPGACK